MHAGMREIDPPAVHFTARVADAQRLVNNPEQTPELGDADRDILRATLGTMTRAIGHRGVAEQLLHGEPHLGNVLSTKDGLLFTDLETCCRGPVEFDVAHVPEEVRESYSDVDRNLLRHCRILMLAMIATWRWDRDDQLPDGGRLGIEWLSQMRVELDRYGVDALP
jgi:hypothetical protein